jgi:hypothetical protein
MLDIVPEIAQYRLLFSLEILPPHGQDPQIQQDCVLDPHEIEVHAPGVNPGRKLRAHSGSSNVRTWVGGSMKPSVLRGILKLPILLGIAAATCAAAYASQPPGSHGPPWNGPVASSQVIHLGGTTLQVDFGPGNLDVPQDDVLRWIETAGKAVANYMGKFPVAKARILVVPIAGERGVLTGTTWGDVGGVPAFTRMRLGQHTTADDLLNDWAMTHELVHMSFPSLPEKHDWMEEGLATYIEAIARAKIGTLTQEKIWGDMHRDMRKGEPGPSSQGLDETHTWASTYWGGALFCLVADVTLRKETGNRKGLQDAMRGIVAAGGTIDHDWPIERALAAGDRATGASVLTTLYKNMGQKSEFVDLDDLWKQLGVRVENGSVILDSTAPLAGIRERISAPDLHFSGK